MSEGLEQYQNCENLLVHYTILLVPSLTWINCKLLNPVIISLTLYKHCGSEDRLNDVYISIALHLSN